MASRQARNQRVEEIYERDEERVGRIFDQRIERMEQMMRELSQNSTNAMGRGRCERATARVSNETTKGEWGAAFAARRSCLTPRALEEDWLRANIFQSTCTVLGKVCRFVVDTSSGENLVSEEAIAKLHIKAKPHPKPYTLVWRKEDREVMVSERALIAFSVGSRYREEVWCDVVPMDACHLLLGRPWQYDRRVVHDRGTNSYSFAFEGVKIRLVPSKPVEKAPAKSTNLLEPFGEEKSEAIRGSTKLNDQGVVAESDRGESDDGGCYNEKDIIEDEVALEPGGKDSFRAGDDVDRLHVAKITLRVALQSGERKCVGVEGFDEEHSKTPQVNEALAKGVVSAARGSRGNFRAGAAAQPFHPAEIGNINHSMGLTQEADFGPIIPIMKFSSDGEDIPGVRDEAAGAGVGGEDPKAGGLAVGGVEFFGKAGVAGETAAGDAPGEGDTTGDEGFDPGGGDAHVDAVNGGGDGVGHVINPISSELSFLLLPEPRSSIENQRCCSLAPLMAATKKKEQRARIITRQRQKALLRRVLPSNAEMDAAVMLERSCGYITVLKARIEVLKCNDGSSLALLKPHGGGGGTSFIDLERVNQRRMLEVPAAQTTVCSQVRCFVSVEQRLLLNEAVDRRFLSMVTLLKKRCCVIGSQRFMGQMPMPLSLQNSYQEKMRRKMTKRWGSMCWLRISWGVLGFRCWAEQQMRGKEGWAERRC